ncbi:NDP-hexose 2,3-dehydratase family protein [Streptomyces sp. N2-109]|uniref:NDP-hexose 2,3-dehydratase family protein n=1 Tax=Streptomyces gossypii TaxID=2883101 RepID=A0ABT2JZI8_9ACTN|nr:NDP-hexose 2,3-dehydratase family protein [Streptomyces gossypii]MCT2593266.1 NDP-hexose 2,3-dehydratase family protein [Streptomyces gossypii]
MRSDFLRPLRSPAGSEHVSAARIAESVLATGPAATDVSAFHRAREAAQDRIYTHAERVPLTSLADWRTSPDEDAVRHRSGRFFAVEGISVRVAGAAVPAWDQPIIHQPEVGVLGMLMKDFDGIAHFLVQLKAEPGNRDGLQLSPTVQATRSNYTGVHRGKAVPYLEYFRKAPPDRVLADVRQSEQGAWFLRKHNRNIVVETGEDVEVLDGFHWLTLAQIHRLLAGDDLVNMDARTVLSCLPFAAPRLLERFAPGRGGLAAALLRSCDADEGSLHRTSQLLSWITEGRTRAQVEVESVPLSELTQWRRGPDGISHRSGRFFEVIGVRVEAAGREVGRWSQPMIAAPAPGLLALLVTRFDGVLHALMQLRVEPGLRDVAELAPTVQCTPENYTELPAEARPPFLDLVLGAGPGGGRRSVLFDTMLSDEGGRFHHVSNRHLIVETDERPEHPGYRWMTVHQLTGLLRHSHYLNVQARSLLACLHTLTASASASAS